MDKMIVAVVDAIVVPVSGFIPLLASTGILFLAFAGLWAAFGIALVRDRQGLDTAWIRIRCLPLIVQGLAWLLALPVLIGLWIWRRPWPVVARAAVVAGLAGWNLLVMLPQAA